MRAMGAAMAAGAMGAMLASCGSGESAAVDFDRPVAAVYAELASVDGQVDLGGLIKSPVVARRQAANDRLEFLLG